MNSIIDKARVLLGGTNAMAKALGVTPPTVSQWVNGHRPVPNHFCPAIERVTKGAVTCEELAPDVDWAYLRQSKRKPPEKRGARA